MKEAAIGPIILDVEGLTLTQEEKEILLHPNVGGVIFFSRNFESREQLALLAHHIKSIRPTCLLCVDQEGGRVQRFTRGLTKLPKLKVLGDLIDTNAYPLEKIHQTAEKLGQLMALEVRSLGVDLSFAPVLDLDQRISDVMKDRAIHGDPAIVSELGTSYIKGMATVGMKATGKHFPGHGSVKIDSHLALPEDLRSFDEIENDLAPFRYLIHQGIAGIMPAHIIYPNIDQYPVGFSSYWLQKVLRQELRFQGTIISDDLSMEGASGMGNYAERANKAISAGCDYVLVCNNRKGAISVLEGTSTINNASTQNRRMNMFASGEAPSWLHLEQTTLWQAAYESIAQLETVLCQEIT